MLVPVTGIQLSGSTSGAKYSASLTIGYRMFLIDLLFSAELGVAAVCLGSEGRPNCLLADLEIHCVVFLAFRLVWLLCWVLPLVALARKGDLTVCSHPCFPADSCHVWGYVCHDPSPLVFSIPSFEFWVMAFLFEVGHTHSLLGE